MDDLRKGEAVEGGKAGEIKDVKSAYGSDEGLKKCLEENEGDRSKCKSIVDAFESSFDKPMKPLTPLWLRSGSLTDV